MATTGLVTRRSLLRASFLIAAGVGAGSFAWLRDPEPGYRWLSTGEVAILEALSEVLFQTGNAVGPDHTEVDVPAAADRLLDTNVDAEKRDAFRYLLRTLEIGTLVSRGVVFSEASAEVRAAVLAIWGQQDPFPRRLALDSLKTVLGMAYFSDPAVLRAVGYGDLCKVPT